MGDCLGILSAVGIYFDKGHFSFFFAFMKKGKKVLSYTPGGSGDALPFQQ